jgi:hypothetical protein
VHRGNVSEVNHDACMASTTRIDRDALNGLLALQHDVITRDQARSVGVTEKALRYWLGDGRRWQVLLPQVYTAVTGVPSKGQQEMAAMLYGGHGSVVTGVSALHIHSIRVDAADMIDVLVPVSCQRRDAGFVRLHRTERMPARIWKQLGVEYALPPRAVGDTVRWMTNLRDVRGVVSDAVQRGRCKLWQLADELNEGPRNGSALFRRALEEVIGGSRSAAEADLRALIIKAGLPLPLFNAEIYDGDTFIARPDGWYPELGIAIEVDSKEWHLRGNDYKQTVQRGNRMETYLINVLRFLPSDLRYEQARVIAEIKNAVERANGRPILNLRTVPADSGVVAR